MTIRSIIVDDEPIARDVLAGYLARYCPVVELTGQAQDIRDAVPLIREKKPQLVFLDVEMPYGNAFDILEACEGEKFETIFITAYSEYSLRALNQSAAYYILKPIDITELVKAVNKVQESILKNEELDRNRILLQNMGRKPGLQQVVLPTLQGFDVARTESILRMQAKDNFTEITLSDGSRKLICKLLKHFEEMLGLPFIRVHRSYIINLQYVQSYTRGSGGFVTMTDGADIEVSASYKESLLRALGNGY